MVEPNNTNIKVWKTLGDGGIEWLNQLLNEIIRSKKKSYEWIRNTLILIYKNNGDIHNFKSYKGD